MKLQKAVGVTSEIWQIFIQDSSSLVGAGLTGLVYNTASLTAYYHRDTDTTATAISLVTMTVGSFTSSGFKEIDATNMPGWYQFCPPNAALASGAKSCVLHLKGAANMASLPIEVQLTAVNPDSATAFVTGVNSLAPPSNWNTDVVQTGDAYARIGATGTGLTSLAPASTALSNVQWTNARAALVDNLDALISSRSAASTALSNVQWTNARAALLDNLDALISSRLATAGYTAPDNTTIGTINTKLGTPSSSIAADIATRAPSSTALSNVQWTNARAALLDALDAAISTRLASGSYTAPDNTTIGTINTKIGTPSTSVSADIATRAASATALNTAQWSNARAALLDNLDALITSRLAAVDYTAPDNSTVSTINTKLGTPASSVSADIATRAPSSTALSTAQWSNGRAALLDALDANISTRLATSGYTAPDNTSIAAIQAAVAAYLDVAISSRAAAATALSNVLWTNARAALIDRLDVAISSRLASGSYTAPDNSSIGSIATAVDAYLDAAITSRASGADYTSGRASKLDNLDATVSSRSSHTAADIWAVGTRTLSSLGSLAADVWAYATRTLSSLTGSQVNAIADGMLDRADAVETGLTPRGALRLGAAADAGKASGMNTGSVVIRNAVADSKARITATCDADGNRTAITTDVA